MADAAQDTVTGYADAVKWIVGLSGAVFAGVFLHPEQMAQRTEGIRIYFAVVLFLLGVSMIGGVVFLLWLNRLRNMRDVSRERKINSTLPMVAAHVEPEERGKPKKNTNDKLSSAQKNMNRWYWVLSVPFYLGAFLGVLAFCVLIALPGKEAVKPVVVDPLRFAVVPSAVHRTRHGMQAHTFLLNQQTGEVWQMICGPDGEAVEFRRVRRTDENGKVQPASGGGSAAQENARSGKNGGMPER